MVHAPSPSSIAAAVKRCIATVVGPTPATPAAQNTTGVGNGSPLDHNGVKKQERCSKRKGASAPFFTSAEKVCR
jgi:hypothetical protein